MSPTLCAMQSWQSRQWNWKGRHSLQQLYVYCRYAGKGGKVGSGTGKGDILYNSYMCIADMLEREAWHHYNSAVFTAN